MHAALAKWLTQTVLQSAYMGQDSYGQPLYLPAVSVLCRLEALVRRFVDNTGTERVSRTRVFVNNTTPFVSIRDQVVLPDGTSPPLLEVHAVVDLLGMLDHWELLL